MLQARFPEATPLYNPSRDVAHNFIPVVQEVSRRLQYKLWPELAEMLAEKDISDEELGDAACAFCTYMCSAKTEPEQELAAAIEKSGFTKCRPEAQIAVMAMIGMVYTGIQHVGIREATINGVGPVMNLDDVLEAGREVLTYFQRRQRKWSIMRWFVRLFGFTTVR
jgi:hypothetical protein